MKASAPPSMTEPFSLSVSAPLTESLGAKMDIEEILGAIAKGRSAFLCGSGLSALSGLSWSVPLKVAILHYLLAPPQEKTIPREWLPDLKQPDPPLDLWLKRWPVKKGLPEGVLKKMVLNTPLEAFCALVQRSGWGDGFLDLFDPERYSPSLKPNVLHRFLANLAAQGRLTTILSLNYDGLLEKAFEEEGLAAGKDFLVFTREDDFRNIPWDRERIRLLLLNGSLADRRDLKKNLNRLYWNGPTGFRQKVLEDLFSQGVHDQVILFEPGGSDLSSLYPCFDRLVPRGKKVIHLHHTEVPILEDMARGRGKDPFRSFSGGIRLGLPLPLLVDRILKECPAMDLPAGEHRTSWVEKAGRLFADGPRPGEEAALLGFWLASVGEQARAVDLFEQALETARSSKDVKKQAVLLNGLGSSYAALKEFPEAVEYHEQALKAAQAVQDIEEQALTLACLGAVCSTLGEYHEALDYYERLLRLSETLRDPGLEGRALTGVGSLCLHLKKYPRAVECFERALALAEEAKDSRTQGMHLTHLGTVYQSTGEYHQAEIYFSRARDLAEERGDGVALLTNLIQLGNVYHSLGEYPEAIACYDRALPLARQRKDQDGEGMILANWGTALANLQDYTEAVARYRQALEIAERRGQKETAGILLANLGAAYRELKDYEKAVSAYEQALTLKRALGEKEEEGILLGHLGTVYLKAGENHKALKCYHKALDILQNLLAPNHLFIKTIEKNILKAKTALDSLPASSPKDAQGAAASERA